MGFDSSLENLYSFNTGTDRGVGGISSESLTAYLNENPESEIYVGMVILTPKEYNKLRKKLNEILKNKDHTHYNFKNVFNIVINHPSSDKDDFSMICSQFVDYIFKFAGVDLTGKDSSIATPTDLKESKNERVKFIYEGLAKDYKSQRTKSIMKNCIRSINAGKHMNLIKGDLVIESVKEKDIMGDFNDNEQVQPFFEKKTSEQYHTEKFKKKYKFVPDKPGSKEGTITVNGKKIRVDINVHSSTMKVYCQKSQIPALKELGIEVDEKGRVSNPRSTCAEITSSDPVIHFGETMFKINPKQLEPLLQHEVGHLKMHSSKDNGVSESKYRTKVAGKMMSERLEEQNWGGKSKQQIKAEYDNAIKRTKDPKEKERLRQQYKKLDKSVREKISADKSTRDDLTDLAKNTKNHKETDKERQELKKYMDKKYSGKDHSHQNFQENEADRFAANKTSEKELKKGLKAYTKKSKGEISEATKAFFKDSWVAPDSSTINAMIDTAVKQNKADVSKRMKTIKEEKMRKSNLYKENGDSIKDELREEDTSVGTMLPVSPLTGSVEESRNKYSEMYNSMMPRIIDKEGDESSAFSDESRQVSREVEKEDTGYRFISESVKKEIDEIDHNIGQMMLESGMDDIEKMVRLKGDENEDCIIITEEGDKETSGRDIDVDMKPIISKLNGKGYETKYSCSGHPSSKDKDDIYKDGVKNGKLYSTARIVFAEIYDFPNIPKYWSKKILDDDKTALYVKAPTFTVLKGLPEAQYKNWKARYMDNLKKWANELPNKKDLKDDDTSDVAVKEDGEDSLDIVMNELKIDLL